MNRITQLSKNIASLHKVQLALTGLEGKHWQNRDVWNIAITVRNSFHTLDQKWRDYVKGNPFFYFAIPTSGFYLDGGGVYRVSAQDNDEAKQQNMLNGWKQLEGQIPHVMAGILDDRNNLLALERLNGYIAVFEDFDALNGKLAKIASEHQDNIADINRDLQQWLVVLHDTLKRHGLDERFNPSLEDSSKELKERVERREATIEQMMDSLMNNPSNNKLKGMTVNNYNFGNYTTVGVLNSGTVQEIREITVTAQTLAKENPAVGETIDKVTATIVEAELEPEVKEKAIDAVHTVSTELAKPIGEQKAWKIKENLDKLTAIATSAAGFGAAATQLKPYVDQLVQLVHQIFPHVH